MFEKVKNKIQNSGIIRKANYGKIWQEKFGDKQIQWYEGMHKSCLKMHDNFKEFIHELSLKENYILQIFLKLQLSFAEQNHRSILFVLTF